MQSLPKQLTVRVTGTLSPLKTAILRWLSKGPRTFDDLVAAFGLPPDAIRRCLRELRAEGLVMVTKQSDSSRTRQLYGSSAIAPVHQAPLRSVAEDHSLLQYRRSMGAASMVPDDV